MAAQRGIGLVILVVLAGLVVGSLLGELLGSLLPAGNARELITRGPMIGLMPPATLDLRFLAMTFGLSLKINLVGVVVLAATARGRITPGPLRGVTAAGRHLPPSRRMACSSRPERPLVGAVGDVRPTPALRRRPD